MLTLSEILITEYKMKSYKELRNFILKKIDEGERFLSIDIKPSFEDLSEENVVTSSSKNLKGKNCYFPKFGLLFIAVIGIGVK